MAHSNSMLCDNHGCPKKGSCWRYFEGLNRRKDIHLAWEYIMGECGHYAPKTEEEMNDDEVNRLIDQATQTTNFLSWLKKKT